MSTPYRNYPVQGMLLVLVQVQVQVPELVQVRVQVPELVQVRVLELGLEPEPEPELGLRGKHQGSTAATEQAWACGETPAQATPRM